MSVLRSLTFYQVGIIISVCLVSMIFGCLPTTKLTRYEDPFDNIKEGMTKQEVLNIVGEPTSIERQSSQGIEKWNYTKTFKSFLWTSRMTEVNNETDSKGYRRYFKTDIFFKNGVVKSITNDNYDKTQ